VGNGYFLLRFNSDSTTNYQIASGDQNLDSHFILCSTDSGAAANYQFVAMVNLVDTSSPFKPVDIQFRNSSPNQTAGFYTSTSAITSIQMITTAGNFDGGTYQIWKLG
jgi:hypothetical protein